MKLMTKELEKTTPKLYSTDNTPIKDRKVMIHYFSPLTNFDWFVYEYDPETKTFFGFANLNDPEMAELGYFALSEFEEVNKYHGFNMIERDLYFSQENTQEVAKKYPVLKKILDY